MRTKQDLFLPWFFPTQRSEPRFISDILITAAVLLDWLPSYVQAMLTGGVEGEGFIFSASKLIIVPLLLLNFITDWRYWFRNPRIIIIGGFLVFLLVLPLLFNPYTAPFARVRPYLLNIPLLFYFARGRSFERCRFILVFAVICASAVPFSQVLVDIGIIQPLNTHTGSGDSVERVFAVTRTATVGVYSALCLSFLGGVVLVQNATRWYLLLPLAIIIVAASITTPLFTSQRAVAIVAGLSLFGGWMTFARSKPLVAIGSLAMVLLCSPLILAFLPPDLVDRWYFLIERFTDLNLGDSIAVAESSAYLRYKELMFVLDHALPIPSVVGPGIFVYASQFGIAPHTFLGALYMDGGILLALIYSVYFAYLLYYFTVASLFRGEPQRRVILTGYTIYLVAFLLNSMVMPIMGDRLVPFTLGFALCLLSACSPNPSARRLY